MKVSRNDARCGIDKNLRRLTGGLQRVDSRKRVAFPVKVAVEGEGEIGSKYLQRPHTSTKAYCVRCSPCSAQDQLNTRSLSNSCAVECCASHVRVVDEQRHRFVRFSGQGSGQVQIEHSKLKRPAVTRRHGMGKDKGE